MSRCITQPGYEVPAGGTIAFVTVNDLLTPSPESLRHERLETSDWTAHETSEDQDSDESDDESTEEESDD